MHKLHTYSISNFRLLLLRLQKLNIIIWKKVYLFIHPQTLRLSLNVDWSVQGSPCPLRSVCKCFSFELLPGQNVACSMRGGMGLVHFLYLLKICLHMQDCVRSYPWCLRLLSHFNDDHLVHCALDVSFIPQITLPLSQSLKSGVLGQRKYPKQAG